jgi:protein gp37
MKLKRPSRIGVAFMGDLFGEWMRGDIWDSEFGSWDGREVIDNIFLTIKQCPQHRFLLLTKCPYNLKNWSPFPDNCWVGVTATNRLEYIRAIGAYGLGNVKAKVKYISFEPLLEDIQPSVSWLKTFDWVIIGQETPPSKKTEPKIDWITSIVKAADEAGIKVFLKNNLEPLIFRDAVSGQYALDNGLLNWEGRLRQGLPKD